MSWGFKHNPRYLRNPDLPVKYFAVVKLSQNFLNDECWKLVLAESMHEIAMEKAWEDIWVLIKAVWT